MCSVAITPRDPSYPKLLAAVPAAPDLWIRGVVQPDDALAVAVVGARRPTPYGLEVAEHLAGELAARGVTIVSGLARGIDAAAHRGALSAGGRTIAVLGCGIDVAYPPEHRRLMDEIVGQGALVSQFPRGMPPLSHHFPVRNRTLAGLSLGVVVVEAGEHSGALITAGFAGDLGREVYAVPGKITSELSRGPHALILDGAKLVRDWIDVVQELPEEWRNAVHSVGVGPREAEPPSGESEEGRVLAMLSAGEPQQIEALIGRSGLTPGLVASALVGLELGGWVRQLPGQHWVRVPERRARRQTPASTEVGR